MPSKLFLKKRPLPADRQGQIIREELVKALKPVAAQHEAQRAAAVGHWKHQPKFKSIIQSGPTRISIRTQLTNGDQVVNRYGTTIRMLWKFANEGTRAHVIRPRFAKILRFIAGSVVVFARLVNHPGTKAKRTNQTINRRLRPYQDKQTKGGFRAAFKRLERENKKGRSG